MKCTFKSVCVCLSFNYFSVFAGFFSLVLNIISFLFSVVLRATRPADFFFLLFNDNNFAPIQLIRLNLDLCVSASSRSLIYSHLFFLLAFNCSGKGCWFRLFFRRRSLLEINGFFGSVSFFLTWVLRDSLFAWKLYCHIGLYTHNLFYWFLGNFLSNFVKTCSTHKFVLFSQILGELDSKLSKTI